MNRSRAYLFAVACLCLAIASLAHAAEPPKEVVLRNLLTQSLSDQLAPGVEIVVSYVEIPPNSTLERHYHPGEEFIYFLEGDGKVELDGRAPIDGEAGTVGHVPFEKWHRAVTGDRGAKALVFRVHSAGKPVRYLEQGDTSER